MSEVAYANLIGDSYDEELGMGFGYGVDSNNGWRTNNREQRQAKERRAA